MEIKKFEHVVKTEKSAFRFWKKRCRKNTHIFCTRCGRRNPYHLGSGRYRCSCCKSDFGEFTNRWISGARITPKQWLWLLKLFTLELSTNRIAKELGLSYPTSLRATHIIRKCIAIYHKDPLMNGTVELDESYFGGKRKGKRGRGAAGKIPVFGILERGGKVSVQEVPDVKATTLINSTLRKVRRGSIVYTDKYKSYDSLMFCGYKHLKVNHSKTFVRGKVHINGLEGFWAYAKERLIKHHGVSPGKFPLYLKELQFRYNERENDIFLVLAKYLVKPIKSVAFHL